VASKSIRLKNGQTYPKRLLLLARGNQCDFVSLHGNAGALQRLINVPVDEAAFSAK
jgi:hypothetical protein